MTGDNIDVSEGGEKPPCPTCGESRDVVLVWQDADDWAAGEDPDFIGCESCGVMVR